VRNILFLEDDKLLAMSVLDELREASYEVDWVQEGDEAAEACFAKKYSLYLFDVNVPGINGFELLEQLRRSGDVTPAIFLTSRHQIDDLARGFEAGGDDYIKKPFDLNELLIRIASKMPKTGLEQLSKHFALDASNLSVTCKENVHKLPAKEFALLSYLCRNREQFLSPDDIIFNLYDERQISIATFRTYIKNLKRTLEGCVVIENMKGVGYRVKIL